MICKYSKNYRTSKAFRIFFYDVSYRIGIIDYFCKQKQWYEKDSYYRNETTDSRRIP